MQAQKIGCLKPKERASTQGNNVGGSDVFLRCSPALSRSPPTYPFITLGWSQSSRKSSDLSGRALAWNVALPRSQFQPALRFFVIRKTLFFGAEGIGVIIAPAPDETRRMLDM